MNKSEIAEKAAREITHYFLEPEPRMEQHIKPISAIVERAIAESQAPQPVEFSEKLKNILDELVRVERDHKRLGGCTEEDCGCPGSQLAQFNERLKAEFGQNQELGDGEPSPPPANVALRKLRNEILGILGLAKEQIRAVVGNTNLSVLQLRLDEAYLALGESGAAQEVSPPSPEPIALCAHDGYGGESKYCPVHGVHKMSELEQELWDAKTWLAEADFGFGGWWSMIASIEKFAEQGDIPAIIKLTQSIRQSEQDLELTEAKTWKERFENLQGDTRELKAALKVAQELLDDSRECTSLNKADTFLYWRKKEDWERLAERLLG